jgi:NADH-quinone oxidoreductase subunit A
MPLLVFYLLVFFVVAVFFLFFHLMLGKLIRPARPEADKLTIYECGEPTVGSAWVQFDLRYYVVALLFVIFDVEVAFFFPWAVVFGSANTLARPDLSKESRTEISQSLLPGSIPSTEGGRDVRIRPDTAYQWAWVAFFDILVFFGVLMVGFAYLWRRGDINWVRSTAAESGLEAPAQTVPVPPDRGVMVGAGQGSGHS